MNSADLEDMVTFLKVIETGGFAAAARELGVTQSTVSRRVSELERRLGRILLQRTTRRVLLTEAGRQYAEAIRHPIQALGEAEACLSDDAAELRGSLRITIPSGFGRILVLPALATFAHRHPMVRLHIDLSDRYVDLLADEHDFSIRMNEPVTSGLETQPLKRRVQLYLCAAPSFLQAHPVRSPADLLTGRCLAQSTYAPRTVWPITFEGALSNTTVQPHMVLSSAEAVRDMAVAGMGFAVLPDFMIEADLREKRLQIASSEITLPTLRYFMVWPRHKGKVLRIRYLREHLREAFYEA